MPVPIFLSPMSETHLTLERMRADVARMVHESPDDIELDDNLMDLGLDSMRMLNLIVSWNETGLNLDFSELAAHSTLQDWWTIIENKINNSASS